ncbi:MAG: 16S rRNA (guanine(527)-N(7))-methyltransferase RsmG [Sutterellaceae bacterium]|nr:16S rRNA (guanine(527)-N(7))-methyltransferase RsmG [Burkholderiaceae bacterium]MCX7900908.1 16S rRNA (guanine(527)-N(7))-methyltransferase RsmG [Burkholderiaceae bacterium]MDW8429748.1 16S rRNA (guanine(527)-N(7))-methyltransferase RsmG [Sutterellaceae bacterium]
MLRQEAAKLGLDLTAGQAHALLHFAALLSKWNTVYNLTALRGQDDILSRHLLDALSIVPALQRYLPSHRPRILDVGTGGGLPGIPVAVAMPQAHVTLLERVGKKVAFLRQVQIALKLSTVEVVQARVETWRAEPFAIITARAFSSLAALVRATRHVIAGDGIWAAMKGSLPEAEMAALPPEVDIIEVVKLRVPRLSATRHLLILRAQTTA